MKNYNISKQNFEKLGKHVQNLREERKISIEEMSYKTGIRKEYLRKIEKGTAYGVLLNKHLIKLAAALEVNLSKLFQDE